MSNSIDETSRRAYWAEQMELGYELVQRTLTFEVREGGVPQRARERRGLSTRVGGGGRQAGQFHWPHVVANDTNGDMYVGEVDGAARIQRFLRYGATGCSGTGSVEVGRYLVK